MMVYVDSMRAPYRRMVMCHMVADTTCELLAMADRIGLSRRWLQHAGTHREHFDLSLSRRALAVANGAVEISRAQLGRILQQKSIAHEARPSSAQPPPQATAPYIIKSEGSKP